MRDFQLQWQWPSVYLLWRAQRENYPSRTPDDKDEAETKVIFLVLPGITGTSTLVKEKATKNKLRQKYILQRMEAPAQCQPSFFFFLTLSVCHLWIFVSRGSFSLICGKKYLSKFLEEFRL